MEEQTPQKTTEEPSEASFRPRIINPVKIGKVVILAADESVKDARFAIEEQMPWIGVDTFSDPISITEYQTTSACAFILDDTALNLVDTQQIRSKNKDAVIVLLSSNGFIQRSPLAVAAERYPYTQKADLVFAFDYQSFLPKNIIAAVIKTVEDRINIRGYSNARRFIFLIVDDEPRWFSQFLPVLHSIIGQRANFLLARNFEQALSALCGVENEEDIDVESFRTEGHGDDIVCLITDIYFPKHKDPTSAAGRDLIRIAQQFFPRIPIVVASKTKEAEQFEDIAFVLPKGDPGSLDTLRTHILDHTGIGDFVLFNSEGRELFRIKTITEMLQLLDRAEEDSVEGRELRKCMESRGEKDAFSTWLYMHSYRQLADELRPLRLYGQDLIEVLKQHLTREVLRMRHTPLVVDGIKILNLQDLSQLLRSVEPDKIQQYSDNDILSSWLDRKGYVELADELRPIHGSGEKLSKTMADVVDKWITKYAESSGEVFGV